MRLFRVLFLCLSLFGLLALSADLQAAKKKEPEKLMPVKIVKPSESKFKQAKIIQQKEAKPRRFLWFKKKEPKVTQPQMAPVVQEPMKTSVQQPSEREGAKLIPAPKKTVKVEQEKDAAKVDLPATTVPDGKNAASIQSQD